MIKLTSLIFTVLLCACTNQNDAERALKASGFKDVRMTGYSLFACSKDDFYHTGFEATSVVGERVSGTVCSGLFFKASTVRF